MAASLFFALVFALGGFLLWLGLRLFGVRGKGRPIVVKTAIAWGMFLPLFFFLVFPLLASYMVAHAGTRPQDRRLTELPTHYGRPFAEVEFAARDGIQLSGWYLEGNPARPAIILVHGLFRDRHEVLERGCRLNARGYPVLLFDQRGHGRSQKALVTLGYAERLDVLGAYDFLRRQKGMRRFVFMGVSMGAVACLEAAAECHCPLAALVEDSPFESLRRTVARHTRLFLGLPAFPFARIFTWNLCRMASFRAARLNSARALASLGEVPVLLIYGRRDRRMPEATARDLFASIPNDRKELVFFEKARHGHAFFSDPEGYTATVEAFLSKWALQNPPAIADH